MTNRRIDPSLAAVMMLLLSQAYLLLAVTTLFSGLSLTAQFIAEGVIAACGFAWLASCQREGAHTA